MPPKKPKKTAPEMTTEELAKRLFPKKLREGLKEAANEPPKREKKQPNSNP